MFAMPNGPADVLLGRRLEQQQLAGLLGGAREGHSGVLVLRGDAGIGKTALVDAMLAQADGLRVVRSSGVESEMEMAYAGVQQLCAPLLEFLDRLPKPQRTALQTALGIADGDGPPDQLLVSLALLTLLAEAASHRPTVCVIDDAHWIDRASMQAMAFAARRVLADRVVILFATRRPLEPLAGLHEMKLGGLPDTEARALLEHLMPGRLDDRVRENIIAEADGNPLALIELQRALGPTDLAGGYGLAQAKSVSARIEDTYLRQYHALPEQTRTLMLLAAAEPAGEATWLWSAAARLGIGVDAAVPAETVGLISLDGRIRFRHPLVRSAIYRDAPLSERRRVHDVLGQAITDPSAAEYRAWHRAHAAPAPDEHLASELIYAAERARKRGGTAAAAAFLAEAAKATPDPDLRARRALQAAQAKLEAGALDTARELLDLAARLTDDDIVGANIDLVRAKLAFAVRRGRDGPPLLLAAAQRLSAVGNAMARDTYLEALMSALIVGRLAVDDASSPAGIARTVRGAPQTGPATGSVSKFLHGLAVRLTDGYAAAAPLLKDAVAEYLRELDDGTAVPLWHDITMRVCLDLFDIDTYNMLTIRQLDMVRAAGQLTLVTAPLATYAGACVTTGDFGKAAAALDELEVIAIATNTPPHRVIGPYLAAYRGQDKRCLKDAYATIKESTVRGEGTDVTVALYATAILHNGLAQYPQALAACTAGLEYDDVGMGIYLLVESIEAASRCGETAAAAEALARLSERADASGTDTALGIAARSRALVGDASDPAATDAEYRAALTHLERSPALVYRARTHLVYGEWLRRANRRAEARVQLRTAYDLLSDMGAEGFAARCRRELQATGDPVQRRTDHQGGPAIALTTQERHITRLVREGYTNSEIGAQLFISPRTVEWHLGRIFAKVGVTSRRELRTAAAELI